MTVRELIMKVLALRDAVQAEDYQTAWRLEIELQQACYNLVYPVAQVTAFAPDPGEQNEIVRACDECEAACKAAGHKTIKVTGGAVTALDTKKLLDLIKQLLPLILSLFA